MDLRNRLNIVWRAIKGSVTHPAELLGAIEMLIRSHESNSGAMVNPATAMRVAAVYSCITVISETIAAMPIMVYRRLATGGKEPAPDHPLMRLFKKPNPWQNLFEFIEMMLIHLCLRGNYYAFMNVVTNPANGKEFIAELIPLPPDAVEVHVQPDKLPLYKYWPIEGGNRSAQPIEIPWDRMLHVRYKSLNGYVGLSPIAAARDVIGLGITLQEHTGSLFKHGAHIGGALEHPETLTDEVAKRIRDSWQETYGGSLNSGKVLVLEEGMKFNRTGMTMQDAQYIDTKKMNRVEIATIYRVPAHKIGAMDKVNYNSMEQAAIEFVVDCLWPWCSRLEAAFDRDLVRADQTYFVKFNMNAVVRGDIQARYTAYKMGREAGFLSADDIRALEDMNPILGKGGDEYIRPMNYVPLGTPAQMSKPIAPEKETVDAIVAQLRREFPQQSAPVNVPVDVRVGDGAVEADMEKVVTPTFSPDGKIVQLVITPRKRAAT